MRINVQSMLTAVLLLLNCYQLYVVLTLNPLARCNRSVRAAVQVDHWTLQASRLILFAFVTFVGS